MKPLEANDINNEQDEPEKRPKRFRFELGFLEVFCYAFGLVVALAWMFVFGILIGRGIPLVSSDELSVKAHLMRFLGLGKEAARQSPSEVAETFNTPQEMLQALDYYKDLTQGDAPSTPSLRHLPTMPAAQPKPPGQEPANSKTTAQGEHPQSPKDPRSPPALQAAAPEPKPPAMGSEHFTLLVSSLKDADNAQKLVDQLRAKGYSPRIESLNLGGSGRWNRVLIGSFQNREEALRFAAEFNRKERTEGLVIRETQ